jgi:hypothetical protein
MKIPLIKGDKVDSNVDYRDALPVNMYVVKRTIKGAQAYMNQIFGLDVLASGEGISRGGRWVAADGLQGEYRVSGNSFIKVNPNGTTVIIGAVPDGGQASIAYSFNNIAVVAGGNLYYYNPTDGFRQITDPQIGSPIDIVWADGLFVLTDGTDLYHSEPLDEESFLPADFGNAQFRPDLTNGLGLNEDNEVIAFGALSTEYFTNQGLANFVYQRIQLKALKLGVIGTHCRKEMSGRWYILGRREETSPSIYALQGGGSKQVATREIEKILDTYSEASLSTAVIDAMELDGSRFIIISLADDTLLFNQTIADQYDIEVAWSILKTDVAGDAPFRAKDFVLSDGSSEWTCGDRINGTIGKINKSIATHYGDIAEWILYTPLVNLESLSINEIEIETIPGFSPDEDATLFMSVTENGLVYGGEIVELYGDNFEYFQRFMARALGYVRRHVGFKFRGASRSRMSFCMFNVDAS